MVVVGTIDMDRVSLPVPAGELNVVAIGMSTDWLAGSVVSVLVSVNVTCVSAPGASGP